MRLVENLNQLAKMDWEEAHITYKSSNWDKIFTEKERTYSISPNNNYFNSDKISKSLFGDCLDRLDLRVRLDLYNWEIEKIQIVK